ncbi:Hypothetical protein I5071_57520 [Sandaracinus amylolyticus]|nr:Hypothetical protein I5071_57520 [Sandaracinus amylolyticus]
MIHNDVLRSVRHMLNVSELTIATIIELGGLEVPLSEVAGYLSRRTRSAIARVPTPSWRTSSMG